MDYNTLIATIRDTANLPAFSDDMEFNAYDCSGGNYDDAYAYGVEDGKILFARKLLKCLSTVT